MLMVGGFVRVADGFNDIGYPIGPKYNISLEGSLANDEICGKVQILDNTGEYYVYLGKFDFCSFAEQKFCSAAFPNNCSHKEQNCATNLVIIAIVVELMATLSVKGEHVINLLQPERGLNFIVKSVIYDILDGKEEALYKVCDLEKHKKVFNRTSYIFPFKLKLPPTLQLPPTWESPNGSIEYQINLYYRLSHSEYKLVHPKVFNFYGSYIFPFEMLEGHKEKFNETSFSRDDLVMTVRLPQLNFLRREVISFTLQIKNPKRIPLLKIGAKLVCKHIAICKNIPRKSEETVDTFVAKKVSRSDKFEVKGAFQTGKVKVPSYEGHPTFKIEYCIEVEMTTGGGPLKGEISLIIGTGHVDPSPSAPPPRPRSSSFSLFAMLPRPSAPRRSITGSTFSLSSLHPSLPTYSALPSRQGSILSLETLPPHYDDVEEQSFLESDKDDG